MKRVPIVWIFCAVALAVAGAGCATFSHTRYQRLEGNYGLTIHKASDSQGEEANPQIELVYQGADKQKQVVWPRIAHAVIHDDTAVFLAERRSDRGGEADRLFAYAPPGPAMDITRQAIEFAVKEKVKGFAQFSKMPAIGVLRKTDEGFEIEVGEPGWSTPYIEVTWAQLADMMREAKEKGVLHKEGEKNTPYLQKPYVPAGAK